MATRTVKHVLSCNLATAPPLLPSILNQSAPPSPPLLLLHKLIIINFSYPLLALTSLSLRCSLLQNAQQPLRQAYHRNCLQTFKIVHLVCGIRKNVTVKIVLCANVGVLWVIPETQLNNVNWCEAVCSWLNINWVRSIWSRYYVMLLTTEHSFTFK